MGLQGVEHARRWRLFVLLAQPGQNFGLFAIHGVKTDVFHLRSSQVLHCSFSIASIQIYFLKGARKLSAEEFFVIASKARERDAWSIVVRSQNFVLIFL